MKRLFIVLIRFYRNTLSGLKLQTCRFYPSCSQYAMDAIEKKGAARGLLYAIKRVLKCHPFHRGGFDPVK